MRAYGGVGVWVVLVVGVLAVLVAGCDGSASQNRGVGKTGISVTPSPVLEQGLPLDAYGAAGAGARSVLSRAERALMGRCMADRGYAYAAPDQAEMVADRGEGPGPVRLADAREHGYSGAGSRLEQTLAELKREHGSGYVRALYGFVPPQDAPPQPQGCRATAMEPLYDEAWRGMDRGLVGVLGVRAAESARVDPQVRKVTRQWARCMRGQGYTYASPLEPLAQQWESPPGVRQVATAVADVGCKQQTGLVAEVEAVEAAYQRDLVRQHAAELDAWEKGYQRLISSAFDLTRRANGARR